MPVFLCGCDVWPVTLREEPTLKVFKNRVLRKRFGLKRDEATKDWRNLHNDKIHNLYSSPHIIQLIKSRITRWTGHLACVGNREVQRGFWCASARERDHLEDLGVAGIRILKLILKKLVGRCVGWIAVAQDSDRRRAVVYAVMNFWVP